MSEITYYARNQYPNVTTNGPHLVTFPYLDRTHVHVFLDSVETTAFTWIDDTTIELDSAPNAGGQLLVIQRKTDINERSVDFTNGAELAETDLDNSALQVFYVAQETLDLHNDIVSLTSDGSIDLKNRYIINLADAVSADHAINKGQLDAVIPNLQALLDQTTTKASEAATSASNASTSETNAANSAATAVSKANSASTSETNAANSASSANTSASNASTSESNAATSASNASTSETNAANSAGAAASSESNAATSAANASTSETNAASSAATATSEAARAEGFANGVNMPSATGNGGKVLVQAANESGLEYQTLLTDAYSDATTNTKGVVKLNTATDSLSTTEAATPSAVKEVKDLLNGKAPTVHSHTTSDLPQASTAGRGIVQLDSAINSTSNTTAATSNALKVVNDAVANALSVANGKAASSHSHQSGDLPSATTTTKGIVEKATQTEMNNGTADKYPSAAEVKTYVDNNSGPAQQITTLSAPSGAFTSGSMTIVKVGRIVTISGQFDHSSSFIPQSSNNFLPSWAEPLEVEAICLSAINGTNIQMVKIDKSNLLFQISYWNNSFGFVNKTASQPFTISYIAAS